MTAATIAPPRKRLDLVLIIPLAWFAVVLLVSLPSMLRTPTVPYAPTSMWGWYLFWQSGVLAAATFAAVAGLRRQWLLLALGVALSGFGVGAEMLGLPLDLYACSEWVRVARETGVFTLW